jgi:hypothetical protein
MSLKYDTQPTSGTLKRDVWINVAIRVQTNGGRTYGGKEGYVEDYKDS